MVEQIPLDPPLDTIKRYPSDPLPPDSVTARKLVSNWVEQEATPGYAPPAGSWPLDSEGKSSRAEIPMLRHLFDECGGKEHLREGPRTHICNEISFKLAIALCGGTLCGHFTDDEATTEEDAAEGTELMRCLADSGIVKGSCGFAFILHNGDFVEEDVERAAKYHRQAASAGYAQSMHELGTMHYLGDGLPEDTVEAVRWFRAAAERGIPGSMYLLGELLLAGDGTPQDVASAFGWFAAAGELGHRGARARLIRVCGLADTPEAGRYDDVASIKMRAWAEMLLGE